MRCLLIIIKENDQRTRASVAAREVALIAFFCDHTPAPFARIKRLAFRVARRNDGDLRSTLKDNDGQNIAARFSSSPSSVSHKKRPNQERCRTCKRASRTESERAGVGVLLQAVISSTPRLPHPVVVNLARTVGRKTLRAPKHSFPSSFFRLDQFPEPRLDTLALLLTLSHAAFVLPPRCSAQGRLTSLF